MPMWTPPVQERLPIEDGDHNDDDMMMTMMKTMIILRAKSTLR